MVRPVPGHATGEVEQVAVGSVPVEPGQLVVLAVGVVVARLGAAELVAAADHGHAMREEQGGEQVPLLASPQGEDAGVSGGSLGAAVPGPVVVGAVAVGFAVGVVVLSLVADEVDEGEPVMRGDEVDAGERGAAVVGVEVGAAGEPVAELGQAGSATPPQVAHGVAEAAVPLRPQWREATDLVAPGAKVLRLGDELHAIDHGVLLDRGEERGERVDVMWTAGERGGEVETETVDMHVGRLGSWAWAARTSRVRSTSRATCSPHSVRCGRRAPQLRIGPRQLGAIAAAAARVGAIRRPLPPPPEEARPNGVRHSQRRDAQAVSHHYDVGNDFYRLVLGPSMTYSCARFARPEMSLEQAQASKHDLVCRKLGLHERRGARLLDVGCGWGSMAIHAASRYGARVVGVTISREQHALADRRAAEAGVDDLVEIRLQDYRELRGETFDAISSIGMSEHVGSARIDDYFAGLAALLAPQGRLLNHAISAVGGSKLSARSFMGRYAFPDGELLDVAATVAAMQRAGLEVRDVESLREHYAQTLRAWVANLERSWDDAVALVGERRARVWRLYMAASAVGFEDGGLAVHQVLGVARATDGVSGMPRTREGWVADAGPAAST